MSFDSWNNTWTVFFCLAFCGPSSNGGGFRPMDSLELQCTFKNWPGIYIWYHLIIFAESCDKRPCPVSSLWISLHNLDSCRCIFTNTPSETIMIKAQLEIKIPRSSLCLVRFLSPLCVIKCLRVSFLFMILWYLGYKSIIFVQPCENHWGPANGICGVWYCPNHPKSPSTWVLPNLYWFRLYIGVCQLEDRLNTFQSRAIRDHSCLGGVSKYFLFSPRKLGKISYLTSIFFKGVVQPPNAQITSTLNPNLKPAMGRLLIAVQNDDKLQWCLEGLVGRMLQQFE